MSEVLRRLNLYCWWYGHTPVLVSSGPWNGEFHECAECKKRAYHSPVQGELWTTWGSWA